MPETAYQGVGRLARVNPIILFMVAIIILATVSMFGLAKSDINDGLIGFIGGCWACVLVGFSYFLWRRGSA